MRPNLLLITAHDLGQYLGSYGWDHVHSPALDGLAGTGARFANSFATAPQCSPSRAALHSGRYPHATGMLGLANLGWSPLREERFLTHYLRDAGYETALYGELHLGREPQALGYERAFPVQDGRRLAEAAAAYLQEQAGREHPFFLEVGFTEVHRPFLWQGAAPYDEEGVEVPAYLPDSLAARQEFAALQGAIRVLDDGVALLLSALEKADLADHTWVIFAADHGLPMPRAKTTLYDPGIEAALLMRWPAGGIDAGRVYREMVSNVDLVPTILEALEVPRPASLQGRSFWPLLQEAGYRPRDRVFAEKTFHTYYDPMRAVRSDRYKLIVSFEATPAVEIPLDISWSPLYRSAPERFAGERVPRELYELETDPLERRNLSGQRAYRVIEEALMAQLADWMYETADPLLEGPIASPRYQSLMKEIAAAGRQRGPGA